MSELSERAENRLGRLVAETQRRCRLPGLVLAITPAYDLVEYFQAGTADCDQGLAAGSDVQFRIGSITKTVTAVGIMQMVAEGRLGLEEPLGDRWPHAPQPALPVGALLSHTSGLQREPVGEVWETLLPPTREELPEKAAEARVLYPSGSFWHYSNLGYALLGELLVQVSGLPWEHYVRERIFNPLGMTRTSMQPAAPHAQGYAVDPNSDRIFVEPAVDTRGIAPAAQLWSTSHDLAIWANFLGQGHPKVLRREELDRMATPRVLADLTTWRLAWGLGLMLLRSGDRTYVGHTGSMPGFLAACFWWPAGGWGVVSLTNATAGMRIGAVASQALDILAEEARPMVPWRPDGAIPREVSSVLGSWWSEWSQWIFTWRDGELVSSPADAVDGSEPERYRPVGVDRYVTVNGPERGEELRLERDSGGSVVKMYRATYPFTREPRTFGQGRNAPR